MNKNIRKIVKKSGIFFFWGIRLLPKAKREAMYTLYAFFRHIDNIVDDDMEMEEKVELIKAWREEISNIYDKKVPVTDIGRKIYKNCMRFSLPKTELLRVINCLAMDIPNPVQAPSMKVFLEYCRGVGGSPCNLSLRVLGCNDEDLIENLSTELGNAIQITSILRDLKEDSLMERLYIPKELLENAGIFTEEPFKVVTDKNIVIARQELADIAQKNFDESYALIDKLDKKIAMPVRGLANVYKRYFDIMNKRGWEIISPKPHVGKFSKISLICKSLVGKKA